MPIANNVNNAFTDLFDALLSTSNDGVIVYPNRNPLFWKAIFKSDVPGFEALSMDEISYDLETLGIFIPPSDFGTQTRMIEYALPDSSTVKLKVKFTRIEKMERLVIYNR